MRINLKVLTDQLALHLDDVFFKIDVFDLPAIIAHGMMMMRCTGQLESIFPAAQRDASHQPLRKEKSISR